MAGARRQRDLQNPSPVARRLTSVVRRWPGQWRYGHGFERRIDCPPGWNCIGGDNDESGAARVTPPGELDACIIVGTRPLYYHPSKDPLPKPWSMKCCRSSRCFASCAARRPSSCSRFTVACSWCASSAGTVSPRLLRSAHHRLCAAGWPGLGPRRCLGLHVVHGKAGRKYAPQAMALFRSMRIVSMSQQSWPPRPSSRSTRNNLLITPALWHSRRRSSSAGPLVSRGGRRCAPGIWPLRNTCRDATACRGLTPEPARSADRSRCVAVARQCRDRSIPPQQSPGVRHAAALGMPQRAAS